MTQSEHFQTSQTGKEFWGDGAQHQGVGCYGRFFLWLSEWLSLELTEHRQALQRQWLWTRLQAKGPLASSLAFLVSAQVSLA